MTILMKFSKFKKKADITYFLIMAKQIRIFIYKFIIDDL